MAANNKTNDQVIEAFAEALCKCRNVDEGKGVFELAYKHLAGPADWARLKKAYDATPKLILKEATAAANLNALSAHVNQIIARRMAGK